MQQQQEVHKQIMEHQQACMAHIRSSMTTIRTSQSCDCVLLVALLPKDATHRERAILQRTQTLKEQRTKQVDSASLP
eukprot:1746115-Amphidinium_carterae.1